MLSDLFQPFIQQAPFCVLARATLERLLNPQVLDQLFLDTAQQRYTRHFLFS